MGRIVCCGTCARWERNDSINGASSQPDTADTLGLCNWSLPEETPFAFKVSKQRWCTTRDQGTECPCWTPNVENRDESWRVVRLTSAKDIIRKTIETADAIRACDDAIGLKGLK